MADPYRVKLLAGNNIVPQDADAFQFHLNDVAWFDIGGLTGSTCKNEVSRI